MVTGAADQQPDQVLQPTAIDEGNAVETIAEADTTTVEAEGGGSVRMGTAVCGQAGVNCEKHAANGATIADCFLHKDSDRCVGHASHRPAFGAIDVGHGESSATRAGSRIKITNRNG